MDEDGYPKVLRQPLNDKFNLLSPDQHPHTHFDNCGHPRILYENRIEFIHDMELHTEIENGIII